MKKKKRIENLENKVEQLEKDLKFQKWMINSLLTLQGMKVTGANAISTIKPVKLESYKQCMCNMEDKE